MPAGSTVSVDGSSACPRGQLESRAGPASLFSINCPSAAVIRSPTLSPAASAVMPGDTAWMTGVEPRRERQEDTASVRYASTKFIAGPAKMERKRSTRALVNALGSPEDSSSPSNLQ